jgi:CheY-like chemotaxis protein
LVTIKEVMAECISVPVALLESLHILVEPSRSPHDPQGLLHSFSAGRRSVWFNDDLPRADRAVVAHAISEHYDIVTTDWAMKDGAFREFLKRLQRMPDRQLPIWRLPYIYVAARGLTH